MLEFEKLEDLKKSSNYLSNDWFRVVRNNITMKYTLETKDYGTP